MSVEGNIIKLSWFNVANAANDEKHEDYRFAIRQCAVHNAIEQSNSDNMSILELRVCNSISKTQKLSPEILGIAMSVDTKLEIAALKPQNLDYMSFWRMNLYNSKKIMPLHSFCKWAIDPVYGTQDVAKRGIMLLFTNYITLSTSPKIFWVINSHMPMALAEKIETIKWLNAHAVKTCLEFDSDPLIFYGGDQNTFFDEGGDEMMELFSKQWTHLSAEATPTFKSFPHDKIQTTSTLDHIFVNVNKETRFKKIGAATAIDTGTSDHFLMSVVVELL